jgi:hypothetical protein
MRRAGGISDPLLHFGVKCLLTMGRLSGMAGSASPTVNTAMRLPPRRAKFFVRRNPLMPPAYSAAVDDDGVLRKRPDVGVLDVYQREAERFGDMPRVARGVP